MNNNQMNFDPMTGQPINQNAINTNVPQQPIVNNAEVTPQTQNAEIIPRDVVSTTQQQMNTIPTVDQNKETFIDNTQANVNTQKEEKKDGPNWVFIIILFVIIFACIFFLFPYLLKVL